MLYGDGGGGSMVSRRPASMRCGNDDLAGGIAWRRPDVVCLASVAGSDSARRDG